MTFEQSGEYVFHVIVSSGEMMTIPLTVCESRGGPSRTSSTDEQEDGEGGKEVEAAAPSDADLEKLADLLPAPAKWYHQG